MSNLTKNERYVLGLAKLNHLEEFESVAAFRNTMKMAQQGGTDDDPLKTSVSSDFNFDGDFESFIGDLVDAGYLDQRSVDGIVLTQRGSNAINSDTQMIPHDEFTTLKNAKSLYNHS